MTPKSKQVQFLVCDDNPHTRRLVSEVLAGAGFEKVQFATSGAELLTLTIEFQPRIVITSSRVPALSGLEFTRIIRGGYGSVNRALSIIVMTDTPTQKFLDASRAAGVDEMLVRPFNGAALLARVEAVLLRPRRFVESITYVGPCRRRRMLDEYAGPLRRFTDPLEDNNKPLWEAESNRDLALQWMRGRALHAPQLVDITVAGRRMPALVQVTKQGWAYVFNRETGVPVWPIVEKPVPQTDVPGEFTSATQPFPTRPAPFEMQGITEDDLIDFTPELRQKAKAAMARMRLGPLFNPPAVKGAGGIEAAVHCPGANGGANIPGGAVIDPETAILYVSSTKGCSAPRLVPGTSVDSASNVQWVSVGPGGIGGIDQPGDGRSHGHGIARGDRLQRRHPVEPDQAGRGQLLRRLQGVRLRLRSHRRSLPVSASGVQSTCSIRVAPVASMTRRSKPSAQPAAGGMWARAARKSSSIG